MGPRAQAQVARERWYTTGDLGPKREMPGTAG